MRGDNVLDFPAVARSHDDAIAALEKDKRQFATKAGRAADDEPRGFKLEWSSGTVHLASDALIGEAYCFASPRCRRNTRARLEV